MVLNGALTVVVSIMFLQRLIRAPGCTVFLRKATPVTASNWL
jgi:hypothetical protein